MLRKQSFRTKTTKSVTQYDKAKRAHHLISARMVGTSLTLLCPPYDISQ